MPMPPFETEKKPTAPRDSLQDPSTFASKNWGQSVGFAVKGIQKALVSQRNLRTQLIITPLVLGAGWYFQIATWEWAALLLCIMGMLTTELTNTAIEGLVDLYTQQQSNQLGGDIKDIAAAACLISAGICALIGVLIFIPHLIAFPQ